MKKGMKFVCFFVFTIFANIGHAESSKINLNFFKPFFDSLSIDEVEKQKQKEAEEALESEDEYAYAEDVPENPKRTVKETSVSKYLKTWVFTANFGPVWENAGETQTFNLTPTIRKTYAADKRTQTIAELSLFLGVHKHLFDKIFGQIGVNLATMSNADLKGQIWEQGNPRFNNLSYSYSLSSTRVAAKGIILYDNNLFVIPWITTSIGVSYNQSANFVNTPNIFEVIVNPNFQRYTAQALTYSFGAGLQRKIDEHIQFGVGYEFTDWGHSRLTKAVFQTTFNAISMQHFYTNSLLFNVSYLA